MGSCGSKDSSTKCSAFGRASKRWQEAHGGPVRERQRLNLIHRARQMMWPSATMREVIWVRVRVSGGGLRYDLGELRHSLSHRLAHGLTGPMLCCQGRTEPKAWYWTRLTCIQRPLAALHRSFRGLPLFSGDPPLAAAAPILISTWLNSRASAVRAALLPFGGANVVTRMVDWSMSWTLLTMQGRSVLAFEFPRQLFCLLLIRSNR